MMSNDILIENIKSKFKEAEYQRNEIWGIMELAIKYTSP